MNSSLQAGLRYDQVLKIADEDYELVPLEDFLDGAENEDTRVLLIFLHAKKSTEPLRFKTNVRNAFPQKKIMPMSLPYDRFFVFGVPNENRVVCLFTADEAESKKLTRYHPQMYPGCFVYILDMRLRGTLCDCENLLISTEEPLIPIPSHRTSAQVPIMPPYDVETEKDMRYFSFLTTTLKIKNPVATIGLCGGKLCDGATGALKANCACVEKYGKSFWGIRGVVECQELNPGRVESLESRVMSVSLARMFCVNYQSVKPDSLVSFSAVKFKKAVREVVTTVNNNGGFFVVGWFKPSKTVDDAFTEVHSYHVVRIEPAKDVTLLVRPHLYTNESRIEHSATPQNLPTPQSSSFTPNINCGNIVNADPVYPSPDPPTPESASIQPNITCANIVDVNACDQGITFTIPENEYLQSHMLRGNEDVAADEGN